MVMCTLVYVYLISTYYLFVTEGKGLIYEAGQNDDTIGVRTLNLIEMLYNADKIKVEKENPIRFIYEESPHFEMGYVFAQIIEKYRKMVSLIKHTRLFRSDNVMRCVKQLELIQKLYFEIYHLVNMMHETPRKYWPVGEYSEGSGLTKKNKELSEKIKKKKAKIFNLDRKKRRKKKRGAREKQWRQLIKKYLYGINKKPPRKKPYSYTPWPIHYGWELEYEW